MKYTLKDVLRVYYNNMNPDMGMDLIVDTQDIDLEGKFLNFYQDRVKYFNEIIHVINLDDQMEQLKKSTNYEFTEEDKNFIISVLKEYTNQLEPIRRGEFSKANSDYIIHLYEGFINLFRNCGASQVLIEQVACNMNNRMDVPVCRLRAIRESTYCRFENMINKKMSRVTIGMNTMEKYQWLLGLEYDFNSFIRKWDRLFYIMSELRTMELDDMAEERADQMTEEEIREAVIDFTYSGEVLDRLDNDEEYQNLLKQQCKMLGVEYTVPLTKDEIRSLMKNNQIQNSKRIKKPFVASVEKKYDAISLQIADRWKKVKLEVIREYIPDYVPIPEYEVDYSNLKSVEIIFEEAVKEQLEEWENDKKIKELQKVELPEIDFEEIRRKMGFII